jgi:hypothetical protein
MAAEEQVLFPHETTAKSAHFEAPRSAPAQLGTGLAAAAGCTTKETA